VIVSDFSEEFPGYAPNVPPPLAPEPQEPADNVVSFRPDVVPAHLYEGPPHEGEIVEGEEAETLPGCVDPSEWIGRQAPYRRFIIPGWVARGHASYITGEEGVGKSLLVQQMLTCAAAGIKFLDLEIEPVKAIYLTCEDSMDELWRRQESINKALGITMKDLEGRLLLVSLVGELGNELGTFSSDGRLTPANRFWQIKSKAIDFGANLLALDNASHLFPGNENVRREVAVFLGLLEQLSQAMDGSALLLGHPNKQHAQGNKQGNEFSGSTGWSAHVRNRLFLDWSSQAPDGTPIDEDGRILRKSKANYGKKGEEIAFRWYEWAFRSLEDIPANEVAAASAKALENYENDLFLACLAKATEEKRSTSVSPAAANYAPRVFAKMPTAKKLPVEALERALQRLLHNGIVIGKGRLWQNPSNRVWVEGLAPNVVAS
jgi:RecA-family ATPase